MPWVHFPLLQPYLRTSRPSAKGHTSMNKTDARVLMLIGWYLFPLKGLLLVQLVKTQPQLLCLILVAHSVAVTDASHSMHLNSTGRPVRRARQHQAPSGLDRSQKKNQRLILPNPVVPRHLNVSLSAAMQQMFGLCYCFWRNLAHIDTGGNRKKLHCLRFLGF